MKVKFDGRDAFYFRKAYLAVAIFFDTPKYRKVYSSCAGGKRIETLEGIGGKSLI
jgi:hypothetical protein